MMHGSWKTSAAGVAALIGGIQAIVMALASDPIDWNDFGTAVGVVAAGVVGLLARDNKVSSEEAGAKP